MAADHNKLLNITTQLEGDLMIFDVVFWRRDRSDLLIFSGEKTYAEFKPREWLYKFGREHHTGFNFKVFSASTSISFLLLNACRTKWVIVAEG